MTRQQERILLKFVKEMEVDWRELENLSDTCYKTGNESYGDELYMRSLAVKQWSDRLSQIILEFSLED